MRKNTLLAMSLLLALISSIASAGVDFNLNIKDHVTHADITQTQVNKTISATFNIILSANYRQLDYNDIDIDWGDGTFQNISIVPEGFDSDYSYERTRGFNRTHTYTTPGTYTITARTSIMDFMVQRIESTFDPVFGSSYNEFYEQHQVYETATIEVLGNSCPTVPAPGAAVLSMLGVSFIRRFRRS